MSKTSSPGDPIDVTLDDIRSAATAMRGHVKATALTYSGRLSRRVGCQLYFKHEYRHVTGSFKERGAYNALRLLDEAQRQRGVVAASAGNHALAVAHHGAQMGIPVTVVMPVHAPLMKVDNCRGYGAQVLLHGADISEARQRAMELIEADGRYYLNGYDDPAVIAGAGTLGLELLEADEPRGDEPFDAVVVPVGGAGLIAGIALAIKSLRPEVQIIGVEPVRAASLTAALEAGCPQAVAVSPTLGDGLAVPCVGANAFALARRHVDRVVTVDEPDIARAVLRLVEMEKAVVEGGGAAGLAALLAGRLPELAGKRVAVPLCGGNIDTPLLGRLIDRGLAADGRLCRLFAEISDRPGGMARFTTVLAEEGVSIRDVRHDRVFAGDDIAAVGMECVIETRGQEHLAQLQQRLDREGLRYRKGSIA